MNIQIFGTKKSSDTRKAERFFKERCIKFQSIDLKEKGLSKGDFNSVMQAVGGVRNAYAPRRHSLSHTAVRARLSDSRLSGTAARPLSDTNRMSGRPGNSITGRSLTTMDMRTIEKIEYGQTSAVRASLNTETARELSERFIAFDTETTGLDPDKDGIVELGAVVFEKGIPTASFQSYVNPGICMPAEVSALNHITDEMLAAAPAEKDVFPEFMKFLGDAASGKTLICGHVAAFDLSFLCKALDRLGIRAAFRFIDTRQLATQIPELEHHSLAAVAEYFEILHEKAHQAKEDALTSGRILCKMIERNRNK